MSEQTPQPESQPSFNDLINGEGFPDQVKPEDPSGLELGPRHVSDGHKVDRYGVTSLDLLDKQTRSVDPSFATRLGEVATGDQPESRYRGVHTTDPNAVEHADKQFGPSGQRLEGGAPNYGEEPK